MDVTETSEKLKYLVDTNVLLNNIDVLKGVDIVVSSMVLRELEKHKTSNKADLAYRARVATRFIENNQEDIHLDMKDYNAKEILGEQYDNEYYDNQIVASCVVNQYGLITEDLLLKFKAQGYGVSIKEFEADDVVDVKNYTGIRELYLSTSSEDDQKFLSEVYETPERNRLELVQNEYLLMWDKDKPTYDKDGEQNGYELIDVLKFDGFKLVKLKFKPTEDIFMGKTKPLNVKQQIAFDLLQRKGVGVSLVTGSAGSGKDYVMTAHMMQMLQREEIDKIVFIRNIAPLENAGQTGYLKGDLLEKMLVWAHPLMDSIGGKEAFEMLYDKGKIEIQHFESIRGRSFNRCGVYVTEIQNMTSDHARMLLSRIGKESWLFLNGDTKQTDKDIFKHNSAINTLKKLKGHHLFGMVEFDKVERSDIASLSELI